MKALFRSFGLGLAAVFLCSTAALAQPAFAQPQLEQLLAPIALYPDPLLSDVLVASTRPAEVADAARWSRANPGLSGDAALRASQYSGWDASVQSLTAFPQVLAMMERSPDWTAQLGSAFYYQQPQVMDTVQILRQRAYAAGQLRSDSRMAVIHQGPMIVIQPVQPQVVYVPVYDPRVVYVRPARPVVGITFGPAVRLSAPVFVGRPDWQRRHVEVVRTVERHVVAPRVVERERVARVEPRRVEPHVVVTRPAPEPHARREAERRDDRRDDRNDRHDERHGHGDKH